MAGRGWEGPTNLTCLCFPRWQIQFGPLVCAASAKHMSKSRKRPRPARRQRPGKTPARRASGWFIPLALLVGAIAAIAFWQTRSGPPKAGAGSPASNGPVAVFKPSLLAETNLPPMDVAHSVMVTVMLDFGGPPPSIAEALKQVERQYAPESGTERTFAILDAFGQPDASGKLQISMHVSSERPGVGALVFKRTGEVLWKARLVAAGPPPPEKALTITMEDPSGQTTYAVDGSKNPTNILYAVLNQNPLMMRDYWPDGEERTLTFIYSTCGCAVRTRVRRQGETTVRPNDWPVMFPDDPDAMRVINGLMGWPEAK